MPSILCLVQWAWTGSEILCGWVTGIGPGSLLFIILIIATRLAEKATGNRNKHDFVYFLTLAVTYIRYSHSHTQTTSCLLIDDYRLTDWRTDHAARQHSASWLAAHMRTTAIAIGMGASQANKPAICKHYVRYALVSRGFPCPMTLTCDLKICTPELQLAVHCPTRISFLCLTYSRGSVRCSCENSTLVFWCRVIWLWNFLA